MKEGGHYAIHIYVTTYRDSGVGVEPNPGIVGAARVCSAERGELVFELGIDEFYIGLISTRCRRDGRQRRRCRRRHQLVRARLAAIFLCRNAR